jgi:hypothetical protein
MIGRPSSPTMAMGARPEPVMTAEMARSHFGAYPVRTAEPPHGAANEPDIFGHAVLLHGVLHAGARHRHGLGVAADQWSTQPENCNRCSRNHQTTHDVFLLKYGPGSRLLRRHRVQWSSAVGRDLGVGTLHDPEIVGELRSSDDRYIHSLFIWPAPFISSPWSKQ